MTTYTATTTLHVRVKIQCEACDHIFEAPGTIKAVGSAFMNRAGAGGEAQKELQRKIHQIEKGDYRELKTRMHCPSCGYVQSFMVPYERAGLAQIPVILGALVVVGSFCGIPTLMRSLGGAYMVWGGIIGALLGISLALGGAFYFRKIHDPNASWMKKKGLTQKPAARPPLNLSVAQK